MNTDKTDKEQPAAPAVVMLQYLTAVGSWIFIRVHLCPSVVPFLALAELNEGG
jgi:hypothetical protein